MNVPLLTDISPLNHFLKIFPCQYMQIAENVLVKLPSSMLLPEIRHTQQIKETKILNINDEDDNSTTAFNDNDVGDDDDDESGSIESKNVENVAADDDLV